MISCERLRSWNVMHSTFNNNQNNRESSTKGFVCVFRRIAVNNCFHRRNIWIAIYIIIMLNVIEDYFYLKKVRLNINRKSPFPKKITFSYDSNNAEVEDKLTRNCQIVLYNVKHMIQQTTHFCIQLLCYGRKPPVDCFWRQQYIY